MNTSPRALSKFAEAEYFFQEAKINFSRFRRLKKLRHARVPFRQHRIAAAAVPMFFAWGGGEEEQLAVLMVDGHVHAVVAHAAGDFRPEFVMSFAITGQATGTQPHSQRNGEHNPRDFLTRSEGQTQFIFLKCEKGEREGSENLESNEWSCFTRLPAKPRPFTSTRVDCQVFM